MTPFGLISAPNNQVAQTYDQLIVATGPVSYWPLNESSGTTAVDLMGVNNGTYNGSYTLGATGIGDGETAASFTNGYVECKSSGGILAGQNQLSIEAWALTAGAGPIYVERATSGNDIIKMILPTNELELSYRDDAGHLSQPTKSATVLNSAWHHLVLTVNVSGLLVTFYVDGVSLGTSALTAGSTTTMTDALQSRIALDPQASGSPFNGHLAKVAVYDFQLSSGQVAAHYAKA